MQTRNGRVVDLEEVGSIRTVGLCRTMALPRPSAGNLTVRDADQHSHGQSAEPQLDVDNETWQSIGDGR